MSTPNQSLRDGALLENWANQISMAAQDILWAELIYTSGDVPSLVVSEQSITLLLSKASASL